MAEKRKLPPRAGREPAAKRRVSEAVVATPQSQKKKKKEKEKAPTPRAPSPPPEPVEEPLPSKLKDADGIPVTRAHQSATLSESEYQSIAERFVRNQDTIHLEKEVNMSCIFVVPFCLPPWNARRRSGLVKES